MKTSAFLACSSLLFVAASAFAQDASLAGTYNASYTTTGIQSTLQSVSIVITSVEDGVVKGTGIRHDRSCRGEYPLQGTLKGDEIRVRAIKRGGAAGDCGFGFVGKVEGNALVGKYGNFELQFRK